MGDQVAVNTCDAAARAALRRALVDHMCGRTWAHAFDDACDGFRGSPDAGVQSVVRGLAFLQEDFADHPLSVSREGWDALRRAVVFLGTDREVVAAPNSPWWPFENHESWQAHSSAEPTDEIPVYSSRLHGQPVGSRWNRIPTWAGVALLLVLLGAAGVVIANL